MKQIIIFCTMLYIGIIPLQLKGQDVPIDTFLHHYLSPENRMGDIRIYSKDAKDIDFKKAAFEALMSGNYFLSPNENARINAYRLAYILGVNLEDRAIKESVVICLLNTATDSSPHLIRFFQNYLLHFDNTYFTPQSKSRILELARQSNNVHPGLIKLIGKLNLTEGKSILKQYTRNTQSLRCDIPRPLHRSIKWAAHLSLARMGDDESLKFVLDKVEIWQSHAYTDALLVFGEDLSFIRQQQAVDILIDYLNSDVKLPPVEQDYKEPIAYVALNLLSTVIEGFPVENNRGRFFSDEDLKAARQWIQDHPNYTIK